MPFEYQTNGCHLFLMFLSSIWMVGLVHRYINRPLETWTSKSSVFKCFWYSNGPYLDPRFILINSGDPNMGLNGLRMESSPVVKRPPEFLYFCGSTNFEQTELAQSQLKTSRPVQWESIHWKHSKLWHLGIRWSKGQSTYGSLTNRKPNQLKLATKMFPVLKMSIFGS